MISPADKCRKLRRWLALIVDRGLWGLMPLQLVLAVQYGRTAVKWRAAGRGDRDKQQGGDQAVHGSLLISVDETKHPSYSPPDARERRGTKGNEGEPKGKKGG